MFPNDFHQTVDKFWLVLSRGFAIGTHPWLSERMRQVMEHGWRDARTHNFELSAAGEQWRS
jgi:hypothetical protein